MTRAIILLPLTLLAACDSGPSVSATNASVEEVANKVAAARLDDDFIHPGKWMTTGRIEELNVPGMPPEMAAKMKQHGQGMAGTQSCITPADVRKPGPDFFTGNKTCRHDHFTMGGGKIDARMRCAADGKAQLTTMTGTYSPESYRMAMTTAMKSTSVGSPEGMDGMTMKLSVEGKRIGDCDAATAGKVAAQ